MPIFTTPAFEVTSTPRAAKSRGVIILSELDNKVDIAIYASSFAVSFGANLFLKKSIIIWIRWGETRRMIITP